LAASDLDVLLNAREAIETLGAKDVRALGELVQSWGDDQAMANLLMYPELIPDAHRTATLVEGLSGARGGYAVLAATIGLSKDTDGADEAPSIAERLLELVNDPQTPRVTMMRAAIALDAYAKFLDPAEFVTALSTSDEGIGQNVLAVAVRTWGPTATVAAARTAATRGVLDGAILAEVERRLDDAGLSEVDEPIRHGRIAQMLLPYVPDRREWTDDLA
jgi:hypothetical protein